jgi:hypothetical protein
MFLVDQPSKAYLVTYLDYPPRSAVNKEDKILDAVAEGNAKGIMGKLVSKENTTIGKKQHPGRKIDIESKQFGVYRARIFLVGDRLYQVVALGSEDFVNSKAVEAYFDSFSVDE